MHEWGATVTNVQWMTDAIFPPPTRQCHPMLATSQQALYGVRIHTCHTQWTNGSNYCAGQLMPKYIIWLYSGNKSWFYKSPRDVWNFLTLAEELSFLRLNQAKLFPSMWHFRIIAATSGQADTTRMLKIFPLTPNIGTYIYIYGSWECHSCVLGMS